MLIPHLTEIRFYISTLIIWAHGKSFQNSLTFVLFSSPVPVRLYCVKPQSLSLEVQRPEAELSHCGIYFTPGYLGRLETLLCPSQIQGSSFSIKKNLLFFLNFVVTLFDEFRAQTQPGLKQTILKS